jgi:hypothetical protein
MAIYQIHREHLIGRAVWTAGETEIVADGIVRHGREWTEGPCVWTELASLVEVMVTDRPNINHEFLNGEYPDVVRVAQVDVAAALAWPDAPAHLIDVSTPLAVISDGVNQYDEDGRIIPPQTENLKGRYGQECGRSSLCTCRPAYFKVEGQDMHYCEGCAIEANRIWGDMCKRV